MAIADKDVVAIEQWRGLRNTADASEFELGDLEAAVNVDITDGLKLRSRKGFGSALFAGSHHSMFAHAGMWFGVASGALKRLFPSGASTTLRTGLLGERVDYATLGDRRVYYSDGNVTGCIDNDRHRTWGLEPPAYQPTAATTGGTLPAGTYQYALTFVRSDGQESGTGVAGRVEVPALGGIQFAGIVVSTDTDVVMKRLYISPANDDTMYRALQLAPDETTATFYDRTPLLAPLTTQHLRPPVAGRPLAAHNARVYVADGAVLRYTEPQAPELMDIRKGFHMPEEITIVAPVKDGIYVGTRERLVFLPGDDPAKFSYDEARMYGAVPGTLAYFNAEDFDPAAKDLAAVFMTTEGIVVGLNGGIIKNMTRDRWAFPVQARGAGVVRSHGGMIQYLTALEGTETSGNTAF